MCYCCLYAPFQLIETEKRCRTDKLYEAALIKEMRRIIDEKLASRGGACSDGLEELEALKTRQYELSRSI